MNKFATHAYSKILKRAKNTNGVPEELFTFEEKETEAQNEKRSRSKTQRLRESEEQDDTMSPKKKKKVNVQSKSSNDSASPKKKKKKNENTEQKTKRPKHPDTLPESLKTLQKQQGLLLLDQFAIGNVSTEQTRTVSEMDTVSTETISMAQTWQLCNDAMDAVRPTPLKMPCSPKGFSEMPGKTEMKRTQTFQNVFIIFSRALLKALAIGMLIARVAINSSVNKKQHSRTHFRNTNKFLC